MVARNQNPWQPKAVVPYDEGSTSEFVPIFTDSRWIGEGRRKNTNNATNTHQSDTNTPTHTFKLLPQARITHPNLVTQQARPRVVA